MVEFTVVCAKCGSGFLTDFIEPGLLPECANCGGNLESPGAVTLRCPECGAESESVKISLGESVECPNCGGNMAVCGQELPDAADIAADGGSQDTDASDVASTHPAAPPTNPQFEETIALSGGGADAFAFDEDLAAAGGEDATSEKETGDDLTVAGTASGARSHANMVFSLKAPGSAAGVTIPLGGSKFDGGERITDISLADGERFGRYEIINEIARGGMGVVYRVYDPELRREVALKLLIQQEGLSEEAVKRFLREGRAAANLNHPNIIDVHEMGQIAGRYYFTMDLIDGPSFQEVVAYRRTGKGMAAEEFLRHMRDVCLAIGAAHEEGIYHRDLKPANILLDPKTNRPVVMDFGLAKDNSSMSIMSMTGSLLGSPAYMSPEQARGQVRGIDHRTDIYSMGVVLYEGLTCVQPFKGETIYDTMAMVVDHDPVPPREIAPDTVPPAMQNIILKCMEKDRERRYASMAELAADLDAYLAGGRVAAKRTPMSVRVWRKIRKSPGKAAAIFFAPALGLAVVAAWLAFSSPPFVEFAETAMASGDRQRQLGALRELSSQLESGAVRSEEERRRARELFRAAVEAEDNEVAALAIDFCRRTADVGALPPLLALAAAPERPEDLRLAAVHAIRSIAATAPAAAASAAKPMLALAADAETAPPLRVAAVGALAAAGGGIGKLVDLAVDEDNPSQIRVAALNSLRGKVAVGSPSSGLLIPLCGDPDEEVAAAANDVIRTSRGGGMVYQVYNLGAISKAYEGIAKVQQLDAIRNRQIQDLLDDTDGGGAAAPEPVKPLEAMTAKLASGNLDERIAAVYDLGELGEPEAVPIIEKLLEANEPSELRAVAVDALGKLAPRRRPNPNVGRTMLASDDLLIREHGILLLAATEGGDAVETLAVAAAKEESRRCVGTFARVFLRLRRPEAIPALEAMYRRIWRDSASAAAECLRALSSFEEAALPSLKNLLAIPILSPAQAAAISEAIKDISGEEYQPPAPVWDF